MKNLSIIERLKNVSKSPGIYLWKDKYNNVIYVGKAKNLNKRMQQYFEGALNSYKTNKLVSEIADFEVFIVHNNKEALLLEKHYIDKYNPEYNILLLDDRKYPYIKVELFEKKMEISLSRKIKKEQSERLFYFGPFPNGYGARIVLKLLQREAFFEKGLKITNNDYKFWKEKFSRIKKILSFSDKDYLKNLESKMYQASEKMQYEIALDIKHSLEYLKKLREEQIIELKQLKNLDVFVYKVNENIIYVTILFYRYGLLINKDSQTFAITLDIKDSLENFFKRYYADKIIPDEFLVEEQFLNLEVNLDPCFKFNTAKIGKNKRVLEIAQINLEDFYKDKHLAIKNRIEFIDLMFATLHNYLPLKSFKNIILFDNSNLNNSNPVGVAIVYTNGFKNKSLYRKFNHDLNQSRLADVEYMKKSVLSYFTSEKNKKDFDLIIVDGGLAQVHETKKIIKNLKLEIPVIGLVKDNYHRTKSMINLDGEEIFIKEKELLVFLAQMQNEVDRFAKSHLRKRQKISSLEGRLQSIKGLGKAMESKLLKHFKNYNNIYNASLEELEKVVSHAIALKIFNKEYLK